MNASSWMLAALVLVTDVERSGGRAAVAPPPLDDGDWPVVLGQIRRHRLTQLFAAHADLLGLPQRVAAALADGRRRQTGEGLIATADAALVSTALHEAGVDHLAVKGVSLSVLLHGEPAARGTGDIDLWVRPDSVEQTETVLAELGWVARVDPGLRTEPGDGWRWGLYRYAFHERAWDRPARPTVDIHWRLAHHPGALGFGFAEASGRAVAVPSVGPHVRTLCAPDALVHMVEHGRKEAFPTLRSLVDIVRLADLSGRATVAELAKGRSSRARNLRLGLAVASAIAPDLADWVPLSGRCRRLADTALEGCLSLELGGGVRHTLGPRERAAVSARHQAWTFRSSPGPVSAVSYALRWTTGVVGFGVTSWRRR
jgi:hypothetical protein